MVARPDGLEAPTTWFEGATLIYQVFSYQQVKWPALSLKAHKRARNGMKRYVFATSADHLV
jgi:hypothetical protein